MILLNPIDRWKTLHDHLDRGEQVLRVIERSEGIEGDPTVALWFDRDLARLRACAASYGLPEHQTTIRNRGMKDQHIEARGRLLKQQLLTASQFPRMEYAI